MLVTRTSLSLGLILLATAAVAQPRPATDQMTCGQARALVAARGAVILATGRHTYDRYVRDQSQCALSEIAEISWERTADTAQCPVGYRCKQAGEQRSRE